MSDPALFKDFGKSANDLLFKGFPDSDKFDWKVEFSTSSNGSTFIPRLTKSHDKEAPVGELEAKFGYKPLNVDLTTKIDQNYAIKTEVSSNQVKNGLKFKPSLEINTNAQQANILTGTTAKLGLEVRHQKFTFSGSVNAPLENFNFTTALSGTAGYKDCGFAAGGDVELTNDGTPKSSSFGINYSPSSSFAINGYYKNRQVKGGSSSVVGLSFYNKVASGWKDSAVAADVSYDLASPAPSSSLALGALLKLDDSSNFKFRLNNKGFLSLAYTNQITRPLSVAVSAELNVVNNSPIKPGVKFSFTD